MILYGTIDKDTVPYCHHNNIFEQIFCCSWKREKVRLYQTNESYWLTISVSSDLCLILSRSCCCPLLLALYIWGLRSEYKWVDTEWWKQLHPRDHRERKRRVEERWNLYLDNNIILFVQFEWVQSPNSIHFIPGNLTTVLCQIRRTCHLYWDSSYVSHNKFW